MNLLKVEISTSRLLLKPISLECKADIFLEFTAEITTYMFPAPAHDISETEGFIENAVKKLKNGIDLLLVISEKSSQEFLGCTGLHNLNSKYPELGIWLKKSAHHYGYGLEAITALKEWAGKNLDYEYLIYPVDRDNFASRRIPEYLNGKLAKEYDKVSQSGRILHIKEYQIHKEEKNL